MEKLIVTEEFYIDPRLQEEIEQQLLELPIVQYAWLPAKELTFSENVRKICREECPRYGTSWACPPAVGTVTECRERCNAYPGAFVFTTIAEVADTANLEETLATRGEHEAVTGIRGIRLDRRTDHRVNFLQRDLTCSCSSSCRRCRRSLQALHLLPAVPERLRTMQYLPTQK